MEASLIKGANQCGCSGAVWDCDSTLFDSYELKSFELQLGSAIEAEASRSMSMPRFPAEEDNSVPTTLMMQEPTAKKSWKVALRRMMKAARTVLGRKAVPMDIGYMGRSSGRMVVGSSQLATIPEVEVEDETPQVRKAVSERFTGKLGMFR